MEPRKEELKNRTEPHNEKKSRFDILKLEERIAPNKGGIPNGGHRSHGGYGCGNGGGAYCY